MTVTAEMDLSLASQVAVEVMGWNSSMPDNPMYYPQRAFWSGDDGDVMHDWQPDESIAHAWMVVAKMDRRGFEMILSTEQHDSYIVFMKGAGEWPFTRFKSLDDVPKAICLASLMAGRA